MAMPPSLPTKGVRLARRYPVLASVPESERAAIVRAALRHPLLLLIVLGGGLLLLPPYFSFVFDLLKVQEERVMLMQLAKTGGAVLLPLVIVVPLLTRFLMPALLRKEIRKRGYSPEQLKE